MKLDSVFLHGSLEFGFYVGELFFLTWSDGKWEQISGQVCLSGCIALEEMVYVFPVTGKKERKKQNRKELLYIETDMC